MLIILLAALLASPAASAQEVIFALRHRNAAPPVSMAYKQGVSDYGSGATLAVTLPNPVAAGDFIVATVSAQTSASALTMSVSDTLNGAFAGNATAPSCFVSYGTQEGLFFFANSAAGSDTITLSQSGTGSLSIDVQTFSGVASSSPLDVAAACGSIVTTGTVVTPAITTTSANDLIVAAVPYAGNTGAVTVSSPYTMEQTQAFGGIAHQFATAATTYTAATFTIQYSGNPVAGIIAAFKP